MSALPVFDFATTHVYERHMELRPHPTDQPGGGEAMGVGGLRNGLVGSLMLCGIAMVISLIIGMLAGTWLAALRGWIMTPLGQSDGVATAASALHPAWFGGIMLAAALGLLAFGMTTFFLMSVDALWSGKVFVGAVMGYAYAYGGVAQMVAGIFEVRRRGAAGACAGDSPAK